jgi:tetratricopeptide (TPR) repeat protein
MTLPSSSESKVRPRTRIGLNSRLRPRVRVVAGAVLVACTCFASVTWAEPKAEDRIAKGVRLRRDHRDAEALSEFQRAYAENPSARALAQIALAEQALSSWVQAEQDLERALEAKTDPWIAAHSATLEQALASLKKHLATLTVTSVAGARLSLNDVEIGTLPLAPLRVPAGQVVVTLRLQPDREVSHSLEVPGGAVVVDRVEFPAAASAPKLPPVEPSRAEESPSHVAPVASPLPAIQSDPQATRRALAWGTLGGAGTVLIAAVAAEIVHQRQAARYNDDQRCSFGELSRDERCGTYRGRAETARDLAIAGYIGSGALATASAVLFLTLPTRKPHPASAWGASQAIRPWVALGSGDACLGWQGAW